MSIGTRAPDLTNAAYFTMTSLTDHEMKRLGVDCMYLDISHKPEAFIRQHFPMITENCSAWVSIDKRACGRLSCRPLCTCGGVMVDDNGRTDVDGLYAIGEVSYTGLYRG